MLKVDQLRYFVAAAESGSFVAAGTRVSISPSSISYAVDCLEDALGTSLLVRKAAAGVALTQDGHRLLRRAKPILHDLEDLSARFVAKGKGLAGKMVIGCQEGLAWTLGPMSFEAMQAAHPELKVSIKTTWMETGFSSLDSGEIDILLLFMRSDAPPRNYAHTLLCKPQLYALMRRGHPLDRGGQPVSLRELAKYPQIIMEDGPSYEYYYGLFSDVGEEPEVLTVSNVSVCAQALVGKCDAVSLRIMRPSHPFSPLGDQLAFPILADEVPGASLYAVSVNDRILQRGDKRSEYMRVCRSLFESGAMRGNFYY